MKEIKQARVKILRDKEQQKIEYIKRGKCIYQKTIN